MYEREELIVRSVYKSSMHAHIIQLIINHGIRYHTGKKKEKFTAIYL
jgi:hypothetical protein